MLNEAESDQIRAAIRQRYRLVSECPTEQFTYPVGRESALGLGYEPDWLARISPAVIDRFVGVGNPFTLRKPRPRQRVLDLGCGCGLDTFVSGLLVGAEGRSVGVDLTPEMLEWPRGALGSWTLENVEFQEGNIEELPFEEGFFDLVTSNGVLNLVPDKVEAFREICRILKPGGTLAAADLLIEEKIPAAVLQDMDAWST